MKKLWSRRLLSIILAAAMLLPAAGCAKSGQGSASTAAPAGDGKIVNIGITDTVAAVNPLLMDATEIVKYACGLEFLPLVELNADLEFEYMLASSITTEDNIHFTVTIDKDANWSDGTPVSADDLVFSVIRYGSPLIANTSMMLYNFEGFDDDMGWLEEGATEVSGVVALDEKTVQFTAKAEMALSTFMNTYGRYILTVPKHILGDVPEGDLASYAWFNAPTVADGPYILESYDPDHYLSYRANPSYFKGAPKIERLNFTVVTSSQLLTGLSTGEIDFVPQTMGSILQEDYASVQALSNVSAVYGKPVTHQTMFFNTESVSDVRIRQAILYAIDRQGLIDGFMDGAGEIADGFLSSASPFYSEAVTPVGYNPERAKELVAAAAADGWDTGRVLSLYINSGDSTFANASALIQQQLADVGINVQITSLDLASLMAVADSREYDLFVVQYSYAPVDPYPDAQWLLSADGWTAYQNDTVDEALTNTQLTSDTAEIASYYETVDRIVQEDVPLISLYVISALGAVSSRLQNARADVYGCFNHIELWDVTQ